MATFRRRGNKWHVQVRRRGALAATKSFASKLDAQIWARDLERQIDLGETELAVRRKGCASLGEVLSRYLESVVPYKRGKESERFRIEALKRTWLAHQPLSDLSAGVLARYRDERLKVVSSGTVRREFVILRHCLKVASTEWGMPIPRSVQQLRNPKDGPPRERRLTTHEEFLLFSGAKSARNKQFSSLIRLALETAMRRGELLSLNWDDINLERRTITLRSTKNGQPRTIPISRTAQLVLEHLKLHSSGSASVFQLSPNAVRLSWSRLVRRVGLKNLHFHDLRHEAISRLFEAGLNSPEVALISGHKDPRMLFRYAHPMKERILKILDSVQPN
jgi:integrase